MANPLDIQQNLSRSSMKYCDPELSYARALARTMHVSIQNVCFQV